MTGESAARRVAPVGPIGGQRRARRDTASRTRRPDAESCRSAAPRRARVARRRSSARRRAARRPAAASSPVRHGTAGRPSFASTRSSCARRRRARSCTSCRPRSSGPRRRRWRDRGSARAPASATRPPRATTAGTMPRWTSVTSADRQIERRETPGSARAMNAATSRLGDGAYRPGRRRAADSQVPNSARSRHGTRKRLRPDAGSAAERLVAGVAAGHEVHRLQQRHAAPTARAASSRRSTRAAGRVHREARADLERRVRSARRSRARRPRACRPSSGAVASTWLASTAPCAAAASAHENVSRSASVVT